MKIAIVLAQKDKPELTFDCALIIDPHGKRHKLFMSAKDTAVYLARTSRKVGKDVWHSGGNYGTITNGRKVVMRGYVVRTKDDKGYEVMEDTFHTSWLRLWKLDRHDFWWHVAHQTGWSTLSSFVSRLYRRWIGYPLLLVSRFISGLPNWWVRFTKDEPPCPHCNGSGISYGDSLDAFTEYPCHYCEAKKRMRKCTCNPLGLYPVWGRRFRVRENCTTCGKTSERGWLKVK